MLVLSRKVGEWVIITLPSGEKIKVAVTKVDGVRTRLGFVAAKNIRIDREEIANEFEVLEDLGNK